MTKQTQAHDLVIKTFLDHPDPPAAQTTLNQHLLWISYLLHERLIHLIITLFVAFIVMILFLLITLFNFISWWLILLLAIFTPMLCFYLGHYYFLENTVQRWYTYADRLRALES